MTRLTQSGHSGAKVEFAGRVQSLIYFPRRLGTFLPSLRASERPMAIACLRLLTFPPRPPFPLLNFPRLNLCISRFTSLDAPREYFLAMGSSSITQPGTGLATSATDTPIERKRLGSLIVHQLREILMKRGGKVFISMHHPWRGPWWPPWCRGPCGICAKIPGRSTIALRNKSAERTTLLRP
jgi:hypothetical protein